MTARRLHTGSAAVLLLSMLACQAEPAASSATGAPVVAPPSAALPVAEGPSLTLAAQPSEGGVAVDVRFQKKPGRDGPRTVELWLAHDAGLALEGATPGDAALRAQKQVVAQTPEAGEVRVVLFGTASLERLEDGVFATVRFKQIAPGRHSVQLLERRPAFAPADTELGVTLGPALTFGEESP